MFLVKNEWEISRETKNVFFSPTIVQLGFLICQTKNWQLKQKKNIFIPIYSHYRFSRFSGESFRKIIFLVIIFSGKFLFFSLKIIIVTKQTSRYCRTPSLNVGLHWNFILSINIDIQPVCAVTLHAGQQSLGPIFYGKLNWF